MGSRWFGGTEAIARVLELVGSLVVMTVLFVLTFRILPSRRIPWGDVPFGAELTRAYSQAYGSKSLQQAANSEYGTAEAAMVARAEDIVRGVHPVLQQDRT